MSEFVCKKNNIIVIGDSNFEFDYIEEHYFPERRVFSGEPKKGLKNSDLHY